MTRFDALRSKIFQKKRKERRPSGLNDSNGHDPGPDLGIGTNQDLPSAVEKIDDIDDTTHARQVETDRAELAATDIPSEASQSKDPPGLLRQGPDQVASGRLELADGNLATENPTVNVNVTDNGQALPVHDQPSSANPHRDATTRDDLEDSVLRDRNVLYDIHIQCDRPLPEEKEEKMQRKDKGKQKEKLEPRPEYVFTGCQTENININIPDAHQHPSPQPHPPPPCQSSATDGYNYDHRPMQCCATTKAGMRCSIFIKIENHSYATSSPFCHIHRRASRPHCNADTTPNKQEHVHPTAAHGPSIKVRIDVNMHPPPIQCSGITIKGTRCGKTVRPRDSTNPTTVYCQLHISQQQQQRQQSQTTEEHSCRSSCPCQPDSEVKFQPPPHRCSNYSFPRETVSVQCFGSTKHGRRCGRYVSSIHGRMSPAYCFQHTSQRSSNADVFVEVDVDL